MKKNFIAALVLVLFFSESLFAQIPIKIGGRAGINLASASFDPDIPDVLSKSNRTGFLIGGSLEFSVSGPISIQVEPMYIQKGVILEGSNVQVQTDQQIVTVPSYKQTSKVAFIEIPILVKIKLIPIGVKPYLIGGPFIGFNLSATQLLEAQGFESQDLDVKDNTSSTDFGVLIGGGIEFPVAPLVSVLIDGRYSLGLTDLDKSADQPGVDSKAKSRGIQIVAGIMVGL